MSKKATTTKKSSATNPAPKTAAGRPTKTIKTNVTVTTADEPTRIRANADSPKRPKKAHPKKPVASSNADVLRAIASLESSFTAEFKLIQDEFTTLNQKLDLGITTLQSIKRNVSTLNAKRSIWPWKRG